MLAIRFAEEDDGLVEGERRGDLTARLVGRDRELAEMWDVLDAPAQLGMRAVLVTGEAGIGKTTFLEWLAASAADRGGFTTLAAAGGPVQQQMPFDGLHQLLGALETPTAGPEVQSLRSMLEGRDGASGFGDVVAGTLSVISRLLSNGRVLVLLDDLGELDEDTLRAVELMARRFVREPIALVIAARALATGESGAADRMLEWLEGNSRLRHLTLTPLDDHDVGTLAERVAGTTLPPSAVRWVADASRGNPFLAHMAAGCLSDDLLDRLDAPGRASRDLTLNLPPSRRLAILRRVLPLAPAERRLARAMSAMAQVRLHDMDALAEIAGVDAALADKTFDRLVDAQVVEASPDGYRFVHGLVREALYADIGPAERARLHREIAVHLFSRRNAGGPVDPAELARHVDLGEWNDTSAAEIVADAGDAAGPMAPRTAIHWFMRALELPLPTARRAQVLAGLATAYFHASDSGSCARVAREAIASLPPGDSRDQMHALLSQVRAWSGDVAGALETVETALASSPDNPRLRGARVGLLAYLGRLQDARSAADEALLRAEGTPHALGAQMFLAELANQAGDGPEMVRHLRALEIASRWEPPGVQLWVEAASAHLYVMHGFLQEGRAVLARAQTLATTTGRNPYWAMTLVAERLLDWLAGDWDGYLEGSDAALIELEQAQHLLERSYLEVATTEVASAQDNAGRVAPVFGAPAQGIPALDAVRSWASAGTALCEGRACDGLALLAPLAEPDSPRRAVQLLIHSRLVDLALAAGEPARAKRFASALANLLRDGDGPFPRSRGLRGVACGTGDVDAAREAEAAARTGGMPFEVGQSLLVRASLGDDPAPVLAEAFSVFHGLEAAYWLRTTAAAMRSAGVPVPRRASSGSLGETEREVARLVQQGKTNREIADELSYSAKTIEVYLSRIYAKTGLRSKLELARALDAGLV